MITTLDWLEREATDVISYWNGSDRQFIDGSGDLRNEEDVYIAEEMLEHIAALKSLYNELQ